MNEAERFKEIRENLKITQKALARKLNLSDPQSIRNIESGRVKNIKLNILEKLVEDFSVNLDYLILGKGEMFKKNSNQNNQKKIIHNNGMMNVKNAINSQNGIVNNYNSNDNDVKINEIIDMYKHLTPKKQELYYHKLKIEILENEEG